MVPTKHAQTDPIAGTSPSSSSPKRVKLGSQLPPSQAGKTNAKGEREKKGKPPKKEEIGTSGAIAKMGLDEDEDKDGDRDEDEDEEKEKEKDPTTTTTANTTTTTPETKEATKTEAETKQEPEARREPELKQEPEQDQEWPGWCTVESEPVRPSPQFSRTHSSASSQTPINT